MRDVDAFHHYNDIMERLTMKTWQKKCVTADFWSTLSQYIVDLDEKKYKLGLLQEKTAYTSKQLQGLDDFFFKFQRQLEQHNRTAKGEMPYTFADTKKLFYMH